MCPCQYSGLTNLHVLLGVAGAILSPIYLTLFLLFAPAIGANFLGSDQARKGPKSFWLLALTRFLTLPPLRLSGLMGPTAMDPVSGEALWQGRWLRWWLLVAWARRGGSGRAGSDLPFHTNQYASTPPSFGPLSDLWRLWVHASTPVACARAGWRSNTAVLRIWIM